MKPLLKTIALITFGTIMAISGFFASAIFNVYIESNDRLKYEAAYANSYFKVLNALESGDTLKAKRMLNWYIDAHFITLSKYRFLQSSLAKEDIDKYLCNVAKYKKNGNISVSNPEFKEQVIELSYEIASGC